MSLDALQQLLAQNRVVIFTTYRRDGQPQMSLVTAGPYEDGLAFTTREGSAKYRNLTRDPRCALMVLRPDFGAYGVLDGEAEVRSQHNTDAETLRQQLREVYRAAAGRDHPNWEEYDAAMREQQRVVVALRPGRVTLTGA